MRKPIAFLLPLACLSQTVTVTPATTYQTQQHVAVSVYNRDPPNGVLMDDAAWANIQQSYFSQLANQLGVDTLFLYVTVANLSTQLTFLGNYWGSGPNSLKSAIQAAGKTPYLYITLGGAGPVTRAAYVSYITDVVEGISNAGYTVNMLDIWNEPDINGWTAAELAPVAAAGISALNAAGYFPVISCCSPTTVGNAVSYYTAVKAITGAGVIGAISSHNYNPNRSSQTLWADVATQAASDGIPVWMTEFYTAGVSDIFTVLQSGNASHFMRGLDGRSITTGTTGDACTYLSVTDASSYAATYTLGNEAPPTNVYYFPCDNTEPTYFQSQIFQYIKPGYVREEASITGGSSWNTVAYRSPGGTHVVVVQALVTGSQTIRVKGLPAGTYTCTWTTSNTNLNAPCATARQTIARNGTLQTVQNIPAIAANTPTTAVITFVGGCRVERERGPLERRLPGPEGPEADCGPDRLPQ